MEINDGPGRYIPCNKCGVKRSAEFAGEECPVCLFSKKKVESAKELSPEHREVLRLRGHGMKPTQISEMMGIPRAKVYELLHEANA